MYLGTSDPALDTARSIRNDEIRSARQYREARAVKRAARKQARARYSYSRTNYQLHRSD